MIIALVSDTHANLEATVRIFEEIDRLKVDFVICLGDVVGYGPNPNEVAKICRENSTIGVLGNHDFVVLKGIQSPESRNRLISGFNLIARSSILWTMEQVSDETISYLAGLPLEKYWNEIHVVHASPGFPEYWEYISDTEMAEKYMNYIRGWVATVGHTHVPAIFRRYMGGIEHIYPEAHTEYYLERDDLYILNPGSAGQPRDGDYRASMAILDTDRRTFQILRLDYDYTLTQKKILDAGLPSILAMRLAMGM